MQQHGQRRGQRVQFFLRRQADDPEDWMSG